MFRPISLIVNILLPLFLALPASGEVLSEDTQWQGEIELQEDILIPAGVTLSVAPGTTVRIQPSENTRIDPEYMSHRTEILVRGTLQINGTGGDRVVFSSSSDDKSAYWAGIIVDGGQATINHTDLSKADAAVTVMGGRAVLSNSFIKESHYGLVAQSHKAALNLHNTVVEKNDYGILLLDEPLFDSDEKSIIRDNSKNDLFSAVSSGAVLTEQKYETPIAPLSATYRDEALPDYTVWKGRVLVDGQLRLPPESRLVIMPGTIIEFTKKDTNNDGIGENGLQVQGLIIAKGTPEKPIIFRSAEKVRSMGDWDSINILGSDLAQNIIEYCQIEDGYRGLHFHYSNVAVNKTILRNNYRGAQFQESLVSISNSQFYGNKSGIQTRDSEVAFNNNEIFHNLNGANFFRLNLQAADNIFANNNGEGLRIREGTSVLDRNLLAGNRMGLLVADAVYGSFNGNVMSGNLESGLLVRNSDHIEITGNAIQANGLNGISLRDTRAAISNNLINANGERGIGIISFDGIINNNNIVDNGLYGVGLEGSEDIDATSNWWGESDLDKEIYDTNDEPGLGRVNYAERRIAPLSFVWPLRNITSDTIWAGAIRVDELLTINKGTTLTVRPGVISEFSTEESGLLVYGTLKAAGKKDARIFFTSTAKAGSSDWLGIQLERATGSVMANCDFSYADYGLHIHFVPMEISGCRFINNDLGIRFRSGPIKLSRSLFSQNRIGIRAMRGNMDIFENEISNNEIGVFVREGGKGLKIYRNNFSNNERYNLRLGDFNKDDVDARHNWWGTDQPQEMIFDGHQESYIGIARFEPFLHAPLELNIKPPGKGEGGRE
ncbi:MAG: right-handed parallel beta-helix repeat-containing protein [Thermodesulfobacteriota bacterium]